MMIFDIRLLIVNVLDISEKRLDKLNQGERGVRWGGGTVLFQASDFRGEHLPVTGSIPVLQIIFQRF